MLKSQSFSRPSLLKILATTILSLSSSAAVFAATPDQVIRKAQALEQYVEDNAYRLSPYDLRALDQALSKIRITQAYPGPTGPGPNPYPTNPYPTQPNPSPYPPAPNPYPSQLRATCELLGRGDYANWTYAFRLSLNGQVMEGSDQLDTILAKIEQYRRDGACGLVVQSALTLAARGDYANWTYAFRVLLNGTAISGTDNLETALALIAKIDLANVGILSAPRSACQLLPRGNYANWTYNYRVGVGAEVMSGTDSYATATSTMQRLRTANICY